MLVYIYELGLVKGRRGGWMAKLLLSTKDLLTREILLHGKFFV